MTSRHRITTRRSSVAAGALFLLLAIAVTACGSDTKADDTKADDTESADRTAATYRGTRACFSNNTSKSIGVKSVGYDPDFEVGRTGYVEPAGYYDSLDPISLGGTSWCRQVDGGNFNGGSLQAFLKLPGQPDLMTRVITLRNEILFTRGSIGGDLSACAGPAPDVVNNPPEGWASQRVCGPTTITILYKGTSTYFQEWDITFT